MNYVRRGIGRPLLLLHGLGSSSRTWAPVMDTLALQREVIAVDLPGFGETPPLEGDTSIATLADAVTAFVNRHDLRGIDTAGSSMGARLALELARRGITGRTVALAPGGFWQGWERRYFGTSIGVSIRVVRALQPWMPSITANALGRSLLLWQLSARPWALPADVCLTEMRDYAASQSFDALLHSLLHGPEQQGAAQGSTPAITIGWGRRDRVCWPRQAHRALARFPGAKLHWFTRCGHFPHWDQPAQAAALILHATGSSSRAVAAAAPPEAHDESEAAAWAGALDPLSPVTDHRS